MERNMRIKVEFSIDSTVVTRVENLLDKENTENIDFNDIAKGLLMAVSMNAEYRTPELVDFIKHWVNHPYKG